MALSVKAIAAMDKGRVIGHGAEIPWHLPEDLKYFSKKTTGHTVLMGRKTFDTLPKQFSPLPNRVSVVVTRGAERGFPDEVLVVKDPVAFIEEARSGARTLCSEELWVVGGAQIYEQTMPLWDELYLTLVHSKHSGDVFFPEFETEFELAERDDRGEFSFLRYIRGEGISPLT